MDGGAWKQEHTYKKPFFTLFTTFSAFSFLIFVNIFTLFDDFLQENDILLNERWIERKQCA